MLTRRGSARAAAANRNAGHGNDGVSQDGDLENRRRSVRGERSVAPHADRQQVPVEVHAGADVEDEGESLSNAEEDSEEEFEDASEILEDDQTVDESEDEGGGGYDDGEVRIQGASRLEEAIRRNKQPTAARRQLAATGPRVEERRFGNLPITARDSPPYLVSNKNATVSNRRGVGKIGFQNVAKHEQEKIPLPFSKWIKPDKYMPPAPIESYLSRFEAVSQYNQWTEYDKTALLKASLTGDAAQILWDRGDHAQMTYMELTDRLRARFGSADHRERFAGQLRILRRRQGQSLQDLYNEVCRLMALAYPGTAQTELNDILARDAFIAALNDRELEVKVWDRDPTDVDSAFKAAVRVEAYLQPSNEDRNATRDQRQRRDRYDDPTRMRQVQQKNTETDKSQTLVQELQRQVASYEKRQEDMSKELDKLKLLTECKTNSQTGQEATARDTARNPARDSARQNTDNDRRPNRGCFSCNQ